MRLTCDFFVEHRGIEPLTSGLQSLFVDVVIWCLTIIIPC